MFILELFIEFYLDTASKITLEHFQKVFTFENN